MSTAPDSTTFVSLFHHEDQAKGVVHDLIEAGVPADVIYTLDKRGSGDAGQYKTTLEQLKVPARDIDHLLEEIGKGGILIAVAFASDFTDRVEGIFQRHAATKIDEAVIVNGETLAASDEPLKEAGNVAGGYGDTVERPIVAGTAAPKK